MISTERRRRRRSLFLRQSIIVTINAKIIFLVETLFYSSKLIFISHIPTHLSTVTCYYVIAATTCVYYMCSLYFLTSEFNLIFFTQRYDVKTYRRRLMSTWTCAQYCKESFCVFVLQSS